MVGADESGGQLHRPAECFAGLWQQPARAPLLAVTVSRAQLTADGVVTQPAVEGTRRTVPGSESLRGTAIAQQRC